MIRLTAYVINRMNAHYGARTQHELNKSFEYPEMSLWALYSSLFLSTWVRNHSAREKR